MVGLIIPYDDLLEMWKYVLLSHFDLPSMILRVVIEIIADIRANDGIFIAVYWLEIENLLVD